MNQLSVQWRRNMQLRLVSVAVVVSALIIGILGVLLLNRVTSGLLESKQRTSLNEADVVTREVQRFLNTAEPTSGPPNVTRLVDSVIDTISTRAGNPGLYDALFLCDTSLAGAPERGTKLVSVESVPDSLRSYLHKNHARAWVYGTIHYVDGTSAKGLIVGSPIVFPQVGPYELYLLFPLRGEQHSIDLVRSGVFAAGLILILGLGLLAWFVTARVTGPVREASNVAYDLASGNLDRRMQVKGEDDLARLASSFNSMAESLESQITRLEKLSAVQQQFVSDVSHELRTPLATVRMASELIYSARANMQPEIARCAELLQDQVDRFMRLLDDLLEISRMDAGASLLEVAPVDLVDLTHSILEQLKQVAETAHIPVEVSSASEHIVVDADARRVNRIVRNLIVNAIEHAEGKPVEVTLATNASAASISVRDSGVGLSLDDYENVFTRFWRADPARSRTLGGTGLGLSISREDARLHGGDIRVWGELGVGAQFVLTLPTHVNEPISVLPIEAGPREG